MIIAVITAISALGLCSCGEDNGVIPNKFKGEWEMCGFAPKDAEMSADNIISEKEFEDAYGAEVPQSTIEFDKNGGMKPYTDGSIPGCSTNEVTRISDSEVCYGIEILELDGKELYDNPIKMDVHAKIADDYLFVWEEYANTDEYNESDMYQVYQRAK